MSAVSTTTTTPSKRVRSHEDSECVQTNKRLESLLQRGIFPSADPYILTIPQDAHVQYHHRSRQQAFQFADNTPFSSDEWENLQYQTYRYHDPAHSIFSQRVHDYTEEKAEKAKVARTPIPGTPKTGPKKVISLSAYKKQKVGTPSAEVEEKTTVKDPIEKARAAESASIMAAVDEKDVDPEPVKLNGSVKRKRDHDTQQPSLASSDDRKSRHAEHSHSQQSQHGSAEFTSQSNSLREQTPSKNDMPPKLSPLRRDSHQALPDRLSPTLPESIASIMQRKKIKTAAKSSPLVDARKPSTPIAKQDGKLTPASSDKKRKSPMPRNGFRAGSDSPASRAGDRLAPTSHSAASHSSNGDRSLLVRLKINSIEARKRLRALDDKYSQLAKENENMPKKLAAKLRLEERDQAIKAEKASRERAELEKQIAEEQLAYEEKLAKDKEEQKARLLKTTQAREKKEAASRALDVKPTKNKRPAEDNKIAEAPAKKAKLNDKTAAVPTHTASRLSPILHHKQPSTPSSRKELHEAHMQRSQSKDTLRTPSMEASTPMVASQSNQPVGTPTPIPAVKTATQIAWEAERKRLDELGRSLKHEADAHAKATPVQHQLAGIKSLESLMTYLLAYTCSDEARNAAEPKQQPSITNWRSLSSQYLTFIAHNCKKEPILLGLAGMLSMSFGSHVLEMMEMAPAETSDFSRRAALEYSALVRSASKQMSNHLTLAVLQGLEKSWRKSTNGALKVEKLKVGNLLGGQYQLPASMAVPPVHAVRAVFELLNEWMEGNAVKYKLRLHA